MMDPQTVVDLLRELARSAPAGARHLYAEAADCVAGHSRAIVVEQPFSDAERRRLMRLALEATPGFQHEDLELANIIMKLTGTDTVLVARRAYAAPEFERVERAGG
jgi:hypothetical protein